VATQAHPELKSRPTRPHPLFAGFIGAALTYNEADRLPVEVETATHSGAEFGARTGNATKPASVR
jgi:CTP synthase